MQFRDLQKQYEVLKPQMDAAISEALTEAQFISGPQVKQLEQELAEYVGVKYCITCGNGTDALTLALMAWRIGPGDAVFVPDFTFFASGECPAGLGAMPVFVDVSADTHNMDPDKLEQAILKVKQEGKYTPKVVVTVDLFGLPADYDRIKPICQKYSLLLLEDGAQGFGGSIRRKIACSFGDISTTSFFPAKPLGCYGDGGAIFTDNDDWAALIRSFAVHGKNASDKYDNIRLGMNSRLDTVQAAILLVKLKAFQDYELDAVNEAAAWYTDMLQGSSLKLPIVPEDMHSSWAQYTVHLPETIDRTALQAKLREHGIPTMVYYPKPMHLQGAFAGMDGAKDRCPITEKFCKTVLSLPMHPYLKKQIVQMIVQVIENYAL